MGGGTGASRSLHGVARSPVVTSAASNLFTPEKVPQPSNIQGPQRQRPVCDPALQPPTRHAAMKRTDIHLSLAICMCAWSTCTRMLPVASERSLLSPARSRPSTPSASSLAESETHTQPHQTQAVLTPPASRIRFCSVGGSESIRNSM